MIMHLVESAIWRGGEMKNDYITNDTPSRQLTGGEIHSGRLILNTVVGDECTQSTFSVNGEEICGCGYLCD